MRSRMEPIVCFSVASMRWDSRATPRLRITTSNPRCVNGNATVSFSRGSCWLSCLLVSQSLSLVQTLPLTHARDRASKLLTHRLPNNAVICMRGIQNQPCSKVFIRSHPTPGRRRDRGSVPDEKESGPSTGNANRASLPQSRHIRRLSPASHCGGHDDWGRHSSQGKSFVRVKKL